MVETLMVLLFLKIAEVKTQLGDRITAIENEDFLTAYNNAKNTL